MSNFVAVACDKFGCVIVQKCIYSLNENTKVKFCMLQSVVQNTPFLIVNIYGNYVLQKVIEQNNFQVNATILRFVENDIVDYSRQKIASNVVEKVKISIDIVTSSFL